MHEGILAAVAADQVPDCGEAGSTSGDEHQDIDQAALAWHFVAECLLGIHQQDEDEVGNGQQGGGNGSRGNVEGCFDIGVTGPEDGGEKPGQGGHGRSDHEQSFLPRFAKGLGDGVAIHHHVHEHGGNSHGENADAENKLRVFTQGGLERFGEVLGSALGDHGSELLIGIGQGVALCLCALAFLS